MVNNQPAMRETWVRSLGWENPLEKGKATHSSILAWRIPWTVHGLPKSRTRLSDFQFTMDQKEIINDTRKRKLLIYLKKLKLKKAHVPRCSLQHYLQWLRCKPRCKPRCPTTDEWIKKLWYIYTMEYYSLFIKWNTFVSSNEVDESRDYRMK